MRRFLKIINFILFLIIFNSYQFGQAYAKGGGSYGSYRSSGRSSYKIGGGYKGSVGKSVRVKGCTRKSGTYVAPYSRSAPRSKKSSYSTTPTIKTYSPKKVSSKSYKITSPKIVSTNKPERSSAKKREFLRSRGYDKTPPGQEVDHVIPLSKGGADEPYNMELLPKEAHKQKTKMEKSGNNGYLYKK